MTKKLTKHGNSYALVIDKPILELLRITPETPLSISTDGETLMVSPVRDIKRQKKFDETLEKIHRQYGAVFKRLAE